VTAGRGCLYQLGVGVYSYAVPANLPGGRLLPCQAQTCYHPTPSLLADSQTCWLTHTSTSPCHHTCQPDPPTTSSVAVREQRPHTQPRARPRKDTQGLSQLIMHAGRGAWQCRDTMLSSITQQLTCCCCCCHQCTRSSMREAGKCGAPSGAWRGQRPRARVAER
jgi:hypothetical protein